MRENWRNEKKKAKLLLKRNLTHLKVMKKKKRKRKKNQVDFEKNGIKINVKRFIMHINENGG